MWCEVGVHIYSFACRKVVLFEKSILPLMKLSCPFQKLINHKCEGLFLDFQFYSIDLCLSLMLLLHCLDYYSVVVSFKIRNSESMYSVYLFKDNFWHSESLAFPYEF